MPAGGRRTRRVHNVAAPSFELAWWPFGGVYTDKANAARSGANILSQVRAVLDDMPLAGFEIGV